MLSKNINIDGIINVYSNLFFEYFDDKIPEDPEIKYISDSNHQWKYGHPLDSMNSSWRKIHILIHPFSWSSSGGDNYENYLNLLKEKNDKKIFDIEIAGPGFINFTLSEKFLSKTLFDLERDPRLGVSLQRKRKVLTDFSSPNLAKEMHIGHLRSTTIGDACSRILEFLGHEVIRVNHVGDWGSQFGSLLAYMDRLSQSETNLGNELKDLELFYKKASELFKEDEGFAKSAREFVVRLQSEDPHCMKLWSQFVTESLYHCQNVYDRLGVSLKGKNTVAESFYNNQLKAVITDLENAGLVTVSDGAKCVFLDEGKGKDGGPTPAIVQKSDGGFPYIATDLAAAKHRSKTLKVDDALYFVDARQTLHFKHLFKIA